MTLSLILRMPVDEAVVDSVLICDFNWLGNSIKGLSTYFITFALCLLKTVARSSICSWSGAPVMAAGFAIGIPVEGAVEANRAGPKEMLPGSFDVAGRRDGPRRAVLLEGAARVVAGLVLFAAFCPCAAGYESVVGIPYLSSV